MAKQIIYSDVERFGAPTIHDVHIEAALTNISIAYRNDGFIADQVFPVVKVNKQSDKYFIFEKSSWFRNEAALRAPGARASRMDYFLSTAMYACTEYAAAKGVPDEVQMNADSPLAPKREASEFVTEKLLLRLEKEVADSVFTAANWTNSGAPNGGVWSSDASDPINDIVGPSLVRETVRKAIGRYPNVGVLGAGVWAALQRHPDILDRIKYTQTGVVTENLVAALFGLDKLLIGRAIIDSAKEGAATSFGDVWGSSAWFGYVAPTPGLMTPSAGYIFTFKDRQINEYREDQEHQDVVEALMSWDSKITSADSGYLLTSVV